jgi:hypothetical protein
LYANNHQPLAIDGLQITDMVMIEEIMTMEATAFNTAAVTGNRFEKLVTALAPANLFSNLQAVLIPQGE